MHKKVKLGIAVGATISLVAAIAFWNFDNDLKTINELKYETKPIVRNADAELQGTRPLLNLIITLETLPIRN